jgi:hypothetical protein
MSIVYYLSVFFFQVGAFSGIIGGSRSHGLSCRWKRHSDVTLHIRYSFVVVFCSVCSLSRAGAPSRTGSDVIETWKWTCSSLEPSKENDTKRVFSYKPELFLESLVDPGHVICHGGENVILTSHYKFATPLLYCSVSLRMLLVKSWSDWSAI